ncbi:MAG: hypothetical protein ACPGMX_00080 [Paracoccaceae bacterium]
MQALTHCAESQIYELVTDMSLILYGLLPRFSVAPLSLVHLGLYRFWVMIITAIGQGVVAALPGLNLFVVSGLTGKSILRISAGTAPFVFFMVFAVVLIAIIPALSTTLLPNIYK